MNPEQAYYEPKIKTTITNAHPRSLFDFQLTLRENVRLPLGYFTPVVGYNNAGKSHILTAIEWLIDPFTLKAPRFSQELTE